MTIMSAIVICAVLIAALIALYVLFRRRPGDIWEWSEDAYEPRRDEPRAITRIRSNQIEWEIK